MVDKILEVKSLCKYYGRDDNVTKAIDGISFNVIDGEFIGIMGSSGSGKTTLLNCIATTTKKTEGSILLRGEDISRYRGKKLAAYRGNRIGYLFQNFELIDNLTAKENIMLPMAIHNVSESEGIKRIKELTSYLDIEDILDKFPAELSGGQKQRVAATRALVLDPEIVLADEPTGALDSGNARLIMNQLYGLNRDKKTTILMVTHDPGVASFCSRILFIQDGKLFHELRKDTDRESREEFYDRIVAVISQLGGGSANVL